MKIELEWMTGLGGTRVVKFAGYAAPGSLTSAAVWRIVKILYDANDNPIEVLFADGDNLFDNIWDNRAALSYS